MPERKFWTEDVNECADIAAHNDHDASADFASWTCVDTEIIFACLWLGRDYDYGNYLGTLNL